MAFPAKPVVLIGMMGAGKTSLGRALAQRLGLGFTDSDAVIETEAGCTIADYFSKYGEPAFRILERNTLEKLLSQPVQIIGAGGGAVVTPETRGLLKKQSLAVWLQAEVPVLVARCAASDARPLLKTGDPATILGTLLEKRASLYAEAARYTVRTDAQSADETVDLIIKELKKSCP